MKIKPRQVIIGILVVFALYAIITSPDNAANAVKQAFTLVSDAVRSIFAFFDSLLNR